MAMNDIWVIPTLWESLQIRLSRTYKRFPTYVQMFREKNTFYRAPSVVQMFHKFDYVIPICPQSVYTTNSRIWEIKEEVKRFVLPNKPAILTWQRVSEVGYPWEFDEFGGMDVSFFITNDKADAIEVSLRFT